MRVRMASSSSGGIAQGSEDAHHGVSVAPVFDEPRPLFALVVLRVEEAERAGFGGPLASGDVALTGGGGVEVERSHVTRSTLRGTETGG